MKRHKLKIFAALLAVFWLLPVVKPASYGESQLLSLVSDIEVDLLIKIEAQRNAWNIFVSRERGGDGSVGERVCIRLVPIEEHGADRSGGIDFGRRAVKAVGLIKHLAMRLIKRWIL